MHDREYILTKKGQKLYAGSYIRILPFRIHLWVSHRNNQVQVRIPTWQKKKKFTLKRKEGIWKINMYLNREIPHQPQSPKSLLWSWPAAACCIKSTVTSSILWHCLTHCSWRSSLLPVHWPTTPAKELTCHVEHWFWMKHLLRLDIVF